MLGTTQGEPSDSRWGSTTRSAIVIAMKESKHQRDRPAGLELDRLFWRRGRSTGVRFAVVAHVSAVIPL